MEEWLRIPEGGGRFLYASRAVPMVDREREMGRLQQFLGAKGGFSWWNATGLGKSRLGLELCLWAREKGSDAGFLTGWPRFDFWEPQRPTLMVVDWPWSGKTAELVEALETLASRRWDSPVRVLVLGNVHFQKAFVEAPKVEETYFASLEASWWPDHIMAEKGALELHGLFGPSAENVMRGAAEATAATMGAERLEIFEIRERRAFTAIVDWDGRVDPVMPAMVGEVVTATDGIETGDLSSLLDRMARILLAEWRAAGLDEQHVNLLLAATILGGLKREVFALLRARLEGILPAEVDEGQVKLMASTSVAWDESMPVIPGLRPEGLGQAFAAALLQGDRMSSDGVVSDWRDQAQRILYVASEVDKRAVEVFTGGFEGPIECLSSTTVLCVGYREVDFGKLAGFKSLRELDLTRNEISDLSMLAGLSSLRRLDLTLCNSLKGIPAVEGLENLEELVLHDTYIEDLSGLAQMKRLRVLQAEMCSVTDLSPLAGCEALERLDLHLTPVSDVTPLAGLDRLEYLDLSNTEVTDMGPLAGLSRLRELKLD